MEASHIIKRYTKLQSDRTDIEDIWELMGDFVLPYRAENYRTIDNNGTIDWKKRKIFDSTAVEACDALAASIQGNLISSSVRWFDLVFSGGVLHDDQDAIVWLQECADIIFETIQNSNFNLEAAEAILDLCGFGTMALMEEVDDKDNIIFSAAPIGDIYFEMGANGNVLRFYRRHKYTALQIRDKFGEDKLSQDLIDEIEAGSSNKHEIVFCIFEIPENKGNDTTKTLAVEARPYGYKWVNKRTAEIYKEGGYYEQPAFITRWRTTSDSEWGNAPGFKCLASILDINEMKELALEEAALNIEPPLMTTQRGILSDLERQRAGLTIVSNINDIAALPGRGDANLALIEMENLRQSIRRCFYEDQLQLKESPAMTATEVNVRYELMQRLLGPTMGRLKVEFLDPCITRTFAILYRLGKLPPAPESVIDGGAEYEVTYLGPLPRAQKLETARSIAGFLGQLGSLVQTFPQVMDIPEIDDMVREMGILGGVPAKLLKTEKKVKAERDKRNKEMAKQQQLEEMKKTGEGFSSMAQGIQDTQALPPETIAALQESIGRGGM